MKLPHFKPELEPVSLLAQIFLPTPKQKYNSKFQEFETAQILKIQKTRPNLDQNHHILTNNHEKTNKKEGNLPKPAKTPSFFSSLSSSFVIITHHHLHKQKTKLPLLEVKR